MNQTVDQFPSVRPPPKFSNNNICSSKQTTSVQIDHHTKYQITNRSTSLPSRQTHSSNQNIKDNVKKRRRHASDSNNNNKTLTTSLVTSFIQYLRSELRATTNDQKHDHSRIPKNKSFENINYLSETFNFSNNFYRQQYPIRMSTPSSSDSSLNQSIDNLTKNSDDHEISKLINLLILRVECLANENTLIKKKKNNNSFPTIKEIDQNLIEYLYYLFNKFIQEESDLNPPMIDKTNFVNVCQTLVRNGCFNIPPSTSPDQSFSESTITNNSERTLTQTYLHEYRSETDDMSLKKSSSINDHETWLVVDLEPKYSATIPEQSKCLLQSSTSDDQFLFPNENYFSFEEIKSYESESSQSNYYSPDSSLVDLQNMVQELDEINNTNNNNNTLFNEDGSSSTTTTIDQEPNNTNVIIETTETTNKNSICTGLPVNEHVASSSMESTDSLSTKQNENISRRERKMQERWTVSTKNDTNNPEQLPTKTFLGVEFPPIAVLRRKFSSQPPTTPTILNPSSIKKKDNSSNKTKTLSPHPSKTNDHISSTTFKSSMSLPEQEINTSTQHDQVLDLQSNDTPSLNDIQPSLTSTSELLTDEKNVQEDMTRKISSPTDINHVQLSIDSEILNSPASSLLSISSSSSPSSSSSSSSATTTNTNENKTIEFLLKEIEEEKKEEEYCEDGDNVDIEKKNNCNVEHASGTILINSEPTQIVLLEQEKIEEQETERTLLLSPIEEPCNQLQAEDEPSVLNLSNPIKEITMTNIDQSEQRYKTIEIEEIPDEEDDLSIYNNHSIEPTDCILTDDELKIPAKQSNIKTTKDTSFKFDTVFSCYENALSKTVETIDDLRKSIDLSANELRMPPTPKRSQRPEDDPIALRALQRFEERMNAASATKTNTDETNPLPTKGKSSWSGTLSTPRKSAENLFKTNHQSQSTSVSNADELSPQHDTFIRPRKTLLDDIGLNFGMTLNLFGAPENNSISKDTDDDIHHKLEEQHQPTAIVIEDDNKQNESITTNMVDSDDTQQPMNINLSTTNESSFNSELDNSNSLPAPSIDSASTNSSLNTVISCSSTEQQSLTPYRLQLEGRRRLNTLERIRERHQNHQLNDVSQPSPPPPQQKLQLQNEYTLKPEDLQDPIIRRALERFDEKSRSLAQAKTATYDDIQDPITRRALMRLDTSLKRTIPSNPPPLTNTDNNETWYTNSYTLGSLQSNNDTRFMRYPESSLPPTPNPKPSHVSIHQRFSSTSSSSDLAELSPNNTLANNDQDIPIMRVPIQPVYVTSNNQPQTTSLRQRSRSEDMLSSRDLSIGQTTNLDDNEIAPLQRNHSSNELQQQDMSFSNETDSSLPNTMLKTLDSNFVRSGETSVNYETPTQTYSAYSCEYTRPHRNPSVNSSKSELLSPRNIQQEDEIQSSSAFLPVHPSTNNYYPEAPLPAPSYNSMYTSNNLNQTPYSDDPIVRRALERFNCQMQNSLMSMSQHQPNTNYISRQFSNGYPPRQGSFDTFHPVDPQQYDAWNNLNRSMAPPPPLNTSTGYQSIIGRRRQMRHDDVYHDSTSVGNGYSSSFFINSQNPYPYMNYSDEPPAIPPRLHRDLYHEQQEYLSENINTNNNNNNNGYIHHVYPGGPINGYHSMHHQYIPSDYFQQIQDEEYLRHRAQSTSSNTSSDSVNQIRLMQQRLPPTSTRTNFLPNKNISPDQSQIPSGQTTPSNGSTTGDSVFHRLAYTATKSSLSKSSSNLCANLSTKPPPQQQQQQQQPQHNKSNNLKTHEIDYDESTTTNEPNSDSISTSTNPSSKCQRSRSVDGRARLKNAQTRLNNSTRSTNDYDDNNPPSTVPSSKFTSVNPRRDAPPPRVPPTSRSIISDRTSSTKRVPNGNNLSCTKNGNGIRVRGSNGNLIDTEHEENSAFNDHYQPKIIDNKPRTTIPAHRMSTTNNHIQTSASASSVSTTHSRTRVPIPASANLDRKDSNISGTDLSRLSKRSEDNRILSPNGQRRTVPVSVFAPAKHPVPNPSSSTSPTNESNLTYNSESQPEQQTSSYTSCLPMDNDTSYTSVNNENELNTKLSSTNSALKSSSGNLLNELSLSNDKHDTSKKMNVFERLFRGHKKKV